jgi:hypothetical protein
LRVRRFAVAAKRALRTRREIETIGDMDALPSDLKYTTPALDRLSERSEHAPQEKISRTDMENRAGEELRHHMRESVEKDHVLSGDRAVSLPEADVRYESEAKIWIYIRYNVS